MVKKIVQTLGVAIIGIILTGCASMINGTSQQIGIGSTPSGAKVTVGGQSFGTTPTIADLKRKDNHIVKIEMDGYIPYETTLTRNVSGWVWGNVLFGGLIGLAIDAIGGGLYDLSPEQIQAALSKEEITNFKLEDDSFYVFVTLNPDSSWDKIGQMRRHK